MRRVYLYMAPGLICMLAILASSGDRFRIMRNDFLQFYASTQLLGTAQLYDIDATRQLQTTLAPESGMQQYPSRPPLHTILLWPLIGWLPLRAAFIVFEAASVAALVAFVLMFRTRLPDLPVYASMSVPAVICFINGQDTLFILLAMGAAALAMERDWDFVAGLLVSLCLVKFHLFLLVPVVWLVQRRYRAIAGLTSGALGGVAAAFAVQGRHWPIDFIGVLKQPSLNPYGEMMPNLHGALIAIGWDQFPLVLATSVLVTVLVGAVAYKLTGPQGIALAIVGGLLISYHAYLYDPILLLLPLVYLPGRVWTLMCIPPLYALAAASIAGTLGIVALMLGGLGYLTWELYFFPRRQVVTLVTP